LKIQDGRDISATVKTAQDGRSSGWELTR